MRSRLAARARPSRRCAWVSPRPSHRTPISTTLRTQRSGCACPHSHSFYRLHPASPQSDRRAESPAFRAALGQRMHKTETLPRAGARALVVQPLASRAPQDGQIPRQAGTLRSCCLSIGRGPSIEEVVEEACRLGIGLGLDCGCLVEPVIDVGRTLPLHGGGGASRVACEVYGCGAGWVREWLNIPRAQACRHAHTSMSVSSSSMRPSTISRLVVCTWGVPALARKASVIRERISCGRSSEHCVSTMRLLPWRAHGSGCVRVWCSASEQQGAGGLPDMCRLSPPQTGSLHMRF